MNWKKLLAVVIITTVVVTTTSANKAQVKPPKIDIRKASIKTRDQSHAPMPCVTIDCRTYVSTYKKAPLVTISILLERPDAGILETRKYLYRWETGWDRYLDSPGQFFADPASLSKTMALCDWKKLSPQTLREYSPTWGGGKHGQPFKKKPKIMAYTIRIWIDGQLAALEKTTKTIKNLPANWDQNKGNL